MSTDVVCLRCGGRERNHYGALHAFQTTLVGAGVGVFGATVTEDEPEFRTDRVRRDDYETSKDGATSVAYRSGSQKARLLLAYQAYPEGLTDEEAAKAAGVPDRSCWWKRCNELRTDGKITTTGEVRKGLAGVPRIVCRLVEAS